MRASTKVRASAYLFIELVWRELFVSSTATSAMKKHRKKKNNAEKELKVNAKHALKCNVRKWLEIEMKVHCFHRLNETFSQFSFSAYKLWRKRKSFSTTSASKALKTLWFRNVDGKLELKSGFSSRVTPNRTFLFSSGLVLCSNDAFKAWQSIGRNILRLDTWVLKAKLNIGTKRLAREKICRQTLRLPMARESLQIREIFTRHQVFTVPSNRQ